ncbi:hypothetical protein FRC18_012395 [Serendipita sp. 400]|nr:hypothetical protein FRC18_012395 [Serendipita sp. 400]
MHVRSLFWLLATSVSIASALPTTASPRLEARSLEQIGELAKRTLPAHGSSTLTHSNPNTGENKVASGGACKAKKSVGTRKRNTESICTVYVGGEYIPVEGVHVTKLRAGGDLYTVSGASCLPHGRYVAKRGLGEHELEIARSMGLIAAEDVNNQHKTNKKEHCIIMPFVGVHITQLPSYKTEWSQKAHLAACKAWVTARLGFVQAEITRMRSIIGDYAHADLCPQNTRWTSDSHVQFIDYGEACTPAAPGGYDLDNMVLLTKSWESELCENTETAGKRVVDKANPPTIN